MEPGHEDREYLAGSASILTDFPASMEPGHEDREYRKPFSSADVTFGTPQWSPVMKTGNTALIVSASQPLHPGLNGARS